MVVTSRIRQGMGRLPWFAGVLVWIASGAWLQDAAARDGYIGIYADERGTTPCPVLPQGTSTTLYVVATLEGASAAGIAGAEFRIEISDLSGYRLDYYSPPYGGARGDVFDLQPTNPFNRSGISIEFPCQASGNGRISVGTIAVFNRSGGPMTLTVKRRYPPSDANDLCPLLVLCDDPTSKICMTPTDSGCTTSGSAASDWSDPAIFVSGINVDPRTELTPADLVKRLQDSYDQPISFIGAPQERPVSVWMSEPIDRILDDVVREDPRYRHELIQGHRVLFYNSNPYVQLVDLPDSVCNGVRRYEGFPEYASWLKSNVSGFEDLARPPIVIVGDIAGIRASAPRITLDRHASVVEHLVQLLGSDSTTVFAIFPDSSGRQVLTYSRVFSHTSGPLGR